MYVSYNGFNFAPGECNLNLFRLYPRRSARGFTVTNIAEAHCSGEFCLQPGEDEYDLATRIQSLLDSLQNGGDFALKHTDGTETPYQILNSDSLNISGTQITHFEGPASFNGEWATGGAFRFVVRAEYLAAESMILEYEDSFIRLGDTGAEIRWKYPRLDDDDRAVNEIYWKAAALITPQTVYHVGRIRTLGTYGIPPDPLFSRPFLMGDLTRVHDKTPRLYPNGVEGYERTWSYTYVLPAPLTEVPAIR